MITDFTIVDLLLHTELTINPVQAGGQCLIKGRELHHLQKCWDDILNERPPSPWTTLALCCQCEPESCYGSSRTKNHLKLNTHCRQLEQICLMLRSGHAGVWQEEQTVSSFLSVFQEQTPFSSRFPSVAERGHISRWGVILRRVVARRIRARSVAGPALLFMCFMSRAHRRSQIDGWWRLQHPDNEAGKYNSCFF